MGLYDNQFTGTIPSGFSSMTDVLDLSLRGNVGISGSIPEELYTLTQLTNLELNEMSLTGTLSPSVGNLTALEYLRVSDNQLTGTIPTELANLVDALEIFIHINEFEGRVPDEICNLKTSFGSELINLQADCSPSTSPPNPCLCCNACCTRGTNGTKPVCKNF
jgi:hypothetical protein